MKYLLTGVAVIAAFAFSAPVGGQPASPSGGNPMGMPGPNPGGPGLTPYSTGAPTPAATPSGQMSTGGRRTSGERIPTIMPDTSSPPPSASTTTSATPPTHRRARASSHGKAAHHPSRFPNMQGNNVANQLNQAELARLQSGNFTPPPPPPGPGMGAPPPTSAGGAPGPAAGRMPAGGRTTSDRYGR